jgi:hypothetical protein
VRSNRRLFNNRTSGQTLARGGLACFKTFESFPLGRYVNLVYAKIACTNPETTDLRAMTAAMQNLRKMHVSMVYRNAFLLF